MNTVTLIKESLLQLFYPHLCAGCGSDTLPPSSQLCIKCIHALPLSGFEKQTDNPVEKILSGRIEFEKATAQLYFTKHSSLQHIMHAFKYKSNKDLGHQLGLIMGNHLWQSHRFEEVDALIPLPLHKSKKRKRGYNQAEVLCNGIAEIMSIPVVTDAVIRPDATETQTKKNRTDRWKNMEGKFALANKNLIENKHVLLVDDVITTGATLEACGQELLQVSGVKLSIATLCYASKI
ncbi:ComF family protein [Niabella hibiscisoli]|uniref:ComF family protein n=1 Tax=Niabella hibiscisoli TaxID=1825928 RepID=UPI001F0D6430|nr:phosphoribosyltransferase family protein [Niabella hibiscisoli]MCH5715812.1 ComF family protein [Niabella hibiscisoli]